VRSTNAPQPFYRRPRIAWLLDWTTSLTRMGAAALVYGLALTVLLTAIGIAANPDMIRILPASAWRSEPFVAVMGSGGPFLILALVPSAKFILAGIILALLGVILPRRWTGADGPVFGPLATAWHKLDPQQRSDIQRIGGVPIVLMAVGYSIIYIVAFSAMYIGVDQDGPEAAVVGPVAVIGVAFLIVLGWAFYWARRKIQRIISDLEKMS